VRRSRLLVVPTLLTLVSVASCGSTFTASTTTGATSPGGHAVEVTERQLDLRDPSRVTDPTLDSPGTHAVAGRDLPTTLWYPTTGHGPFPVVVFSHGFGSSPGSYYGLMEAWAASGLVVAAPRFPLTSEGSALVDADVANQPEDVSFVLDQVLALDHEAGDDLAGRVDSTRVAVVGHSAGAFTTLGLLDTCCRDPRATAAVVLSGGLDVFGATPATPGVPTLFLHGTGDQVLPLSGGQAAYAAAPGPKAFVELPGGTHSSPYDDEPDRYGAAVEEVTVDFLRWTLEGDTAALAELRKAANQQGLTELSDDHLTP
jgi:predicted dienelactone hydrolase